jgi:hypothetical protein
MQSDDMANNALVTVRIPSALKRRLEARARARHRSLSAQVLHDLTALADTQAPMATQGRFLGLFGHTPVPSEADIKAVRARLWGRLGRINTHD